MVECLRCGRTLPEGKWGMCSACRSIIQREKEEKKGRTVLGKREAANIFKTALPGIGAIEKTENLRGEEKMAANIFKTVLPGVGAVKQTEEKRKEEAKPAPRPEAEKKPEGEKEEKPAPKPEAEKFNCKNCGRTITDYPCPHCKCNPEGKEIVTPSPIKFLAYLGAIIGVVFIQSSALIAKLIEDHSGLTRFGLTPDTIVYILFFALVGGIGLLVTALVAKKGFSWGILGCGAAILLLLFIVPIVLPLSLSILSGQGLPMFTMPVIGGAPSGGGVDWLCMLLNPTNVEQCERTKTEVIPESEVTGSKETRILDIEFGRGETGEEEFDMYDDETFKTTVTINVNPKLTEKEIIEGVSVAGEIYTKDFDVYTDCFEGSENCIVMEPTKCTASKPCTVVKGLALPVKLRSRANPSALEKKYLNLRVRVSYLYEGFGTGEAVLAKNWEKAKEAEKGGSPHAGTHPGPLAVNVFFDPTYFPPYYVISYECETAPEDCSSATCDWCEDKTCTCEDIMCKGCNKATLKIRFVNKEDGKAQLKGVKLYRIDQTLTDEFYCSGDCCILDNDANDVFGEDDVEETRKWVWEKPKGADCTYTVSPSISVSEFITVPLAFQVNYTYTQSIVKENIMVKKSPPTAPIAPPACTGTPTASCSYTVSSQCSANACCRWDTSLGACANKACSELSSARCESCGCTLS